MSKLKREGLKGEKCPIKVIPSIRPLESHRLMTEEKLQELIRIMAGKSKT